MGDYTDEQVAILNAVRCRALEIKEDLQQLRALSEDPQSFQRAVDAYVDSLE